MKKVIELIKKHKLYVLGVLLVIFFLRSCSKSTQVRKADKMITEKEVVIDSLESIIKKQQQTINGFSEVIREEKIKIHSNYDNYISEKDRGQQLMELHMIVKKNLKELKNEK